MLAGLFAGLLAATNATALPIVFNGSGGSLSASVSFEQVGGNLVVTLTNTSTSDVMVPADVLTAVFFTLAGDPTLTRVSGVLAAGSTVWFGPMGPGSSVGGEWSYKDGIPGVAPGGADEGISSAGYGVFGPGDVFPGSGDLQPPDSPDGLQYGITSAGDNTSTGNTAVTGGNPPKNAVALIQNSVVFTLGLPTGFTLGGISDVSFQYGTGLTEPNIPGVPEPGTLLLLGSGLAGIAAWRRKTRRA